MCIFFLLRSLVDLTGREKLLENRGHPAASWSRIYWASLYRRREAERLAREAVGTSGASSDTLRRRCWVNGGSRHRVQFIYCLCVSS
jgi:hypothetical protein